MEEQEESEERFIELRFGRPGLEIAPVTRSGETSPLPSGSTVRIAAYRRMNNEPDLLSADLPMVDLSTGFPSSPTALEALYTTPITVRLASSTLAIGIAANVLTSIELPPHFVF